MMMMMFLDLVMTCEMERTLIVVESISSRLALSHSYSISRAKRCEMFLTKRNGRNGKEWNGMAVTAIFWRCACVSPHRLIFARLSYVWNMELMIPKRYSLSALPVRCVVRFLFSLIFLIL